MPPEGRPPLPTPTPASTLTLAGFAAWSTLRRLAASAPTRLAFFGALALASKWRTLGSAGFMNDNRDAQNLYLYEEVARRTVARFHELPLWDPYYCGGLPALGTPSARFVSPTFLLTLLFGTIRADALVMFAMTLVGLEGTFRYARARGGGALGAMLVAPVFALSGFFAKFPTFGWTHFYGFELVPWALVFLRAALAGSRRGVVGLGLTAAFLVGFGGTYAAPITLLAAGYELLLALARRARNPRRLLVALGGAALGLAFAAEASLVRLWPVAELLSAAPRVLGGADGRDFATIWTLLFGVKPGSTAWADFLVGLAVLPVFAVGVARRKSLPVVLGALVWLWLAFGYGVRPSLYAWLRLVPPYTMLRAPERFLQLFALDFAVVAALGLRRLEVAARRAPRWLAAWGACALLVVVDAGTLIHNDAEQASYRVLDDTPPVVDRDFHQARGNRWLALYYPMMSRGSLACFDDYNVAQSPALRGDLDEEEHLADPTAGSVRRVAWSPNHVRFHAVLSRPARVLMNQNHHPGWRSSAGTVVSDQGALAVDLPAGEHDVTVRFRPRSGLGGGATSLAALVVAGVALWRSRRRPPAPAPRASLDRAREPERGGDALRFPGDALLFLSPLAAVGLAFLVVREPPRPARPLVTPAGEPMIVDAPPEGAATVDAAWADGITLVASRVTTEPTDVPGERSATVELDWRVTRRPPKGLGVSLRVRARLGGAMTLEYALLSGALLFEDAPEGRVLRDVTEPIRLPSMGRGGSFSVDVGLFRARRSGEPLTDVTGPGARDAEGGRVPVAVF